MKKLLLLTFVGILFSSVSAFAHCGACGTGGKAHAHGDKVAECCAKDGECCKKKSDCTSECKAKCDKAKKCCGTEGKCCKSSCTKDKAAETAAAPACPACPSMKTGKSA